MQSPSDEHELFVPKSNLERTFIQARYMNSMHQWRKGTTELMSENVSQATGFYLALARSQCIDGTVVQAAATLDSIWDYHKRFSSADKLSVIRVICNILEEQNFDGTDNMIADERVRSRFLRISVALAGQLNEDKVTQLEALMLMKRATNIDLIGAATLKKQIASFELFIDDCKLKLFEKGSSSDTEVTNDQRKDVLTAIFAQVDLLPPDVNVFLNLTKLAQYLLAGDRLIEAVTVCAHIRHYCLKLPKTKLSLSCGESISRIFEKALTDPDGMNSFVLDNTLQEQKLQNYLTTRNNVATATFEEHFLSWSKGLGANKFGFMAPESTSHQKYSDHSTDLVAACTLNYLADQLIQKNEFEEACACSQTATLIRIQAQRIDQRDMEDLSVLAAATLISKRYENALALLFDVKRTLQFSTYNAIWCQRLTTYTTLLEHLFGRLAIADCKLSIKSSSTLSYVMILYSRIGSVSQFDALLPAVLELLTNRADRSTLSEILKIFWKELNRLPIRKVTQTYVESLVTLTETAIDRTWANACYLIFLENPDNREFKIKFFMPLLSRIIADREIDGEVDSLTEVPLIAALTMLYLEDGESDKCKIPGEVLRTFISGIISTSNDILKLQCIKALFQFENVFLTLAKRDPHSFAFVQTTEVGSIINEVIQANASAPAMHRELCVMLCDFLASFIAEDLHAPKTLIGIVQFFDHKILATTITKLETKYRQASLEKLVEECIQAKYIDGDYTKDIFVIPLLLLKARYLEKSGNFAEIEKIQSQIIALEKLITDDSSSVTEDALTLSETASSPRIGKVFKEAISRSFDAQVRFLHHLIEIGEVYVAFDMAFEMVTKSVGDFDTAQVGSLFRLVDSFVLQSKLTNAIELMIVITSRTRAVNFDRKMFETFDGVFISCIEQNAFEKAQFLLNRAKRLTSAQNTGKPEQNFIYAAANRYTNAFPDKEAFRFDRLNTALEDLRKKKIFCKDLEIFVGRVFELLKNDSTNADEH